MDGLDLTAWDMPYIEDMDDDAYVKVTVSRHKDGGVRECLIVKGQRDAGPMLGIISDDRTHRVTDEVRHEPCRVRTSAGWMEFERVF